MNQTEQVQDQQTILEIEKKIRLRMETLIPDMRKLADNYNIAGDKSPYRNVLNVAVDPASDVEVTKNFIRYQLGRDQKSPWRKTTKGGKKFGLALVDVISELGNDAKEIVKGIGENLETEQGKQRKQEVHRRLMQLYLGNLVRYQVFVTYQEEEERKKERR